MDNPKGGVGFEFGVSFKFRSCDFRNLRDFRDFIFSYGYGFNKTYGAWHAFWPWAYVQILGINLDFGFVKTWMPKTNKGVVV